MKNLSCYRPFPMTYCAVYARRIVKKEILEVYSILSTTCGKPASKAHLFPGLYSVPSMVTFH